MATDHPTATNYSHPSQDGPNTLVRKYDPNGSVSVTTLTVHALSDALDIDARTLRSAMQTVVDTQALDAMYTPRADQDALCVCVSFQVYGAIVTVQGGQNPCVVVDTADTAALPRH